MNNKARKYAGQLFDIKRKSMTLSVMDKLSHVDDNAEATYLELIHPAAVYKMYILGDIEKGISVSANIKPEHLNRMMMRLQFAEKMLFEKEGGLLKLEAPEKKDGDISGSIAFTTTFGMGRLKGKSPAKVICEASDKEEAIKELQSQYDFLKQNVAKFKKNQEIMNAIEQAISYYEIGLLDQEEAMRAAESTQSSASEFKIYDPPEKTYRKETKITPDGRTLTKCYKITITFSPARDYPYKVTIMNCYAEIQKNEVSKMEVIHHIADKSLACMNEYSMLLTSDEAVNMVTAMVNNTHYYESAIYTGMRRLDQEIQRELRENWKPKE